MKELLKRLTTEFQDGEYAHAYMESHAVSRIAAQIFAIRKQRGWTQKQLSEKSGIAQERISKIESGDFTSLTMSTLYKFARAFDTDMTVEFRSFSEGILDIVNLKSDKLKVEERNSDLSCFCTMHLNQRKDGMLVAYTIPTGITSISPQGLIEPVVTHAPRAQVDAFRLNGTWQPLNVEVPTQTRVAASARG